MLLFLIPGPPVFVLALSLLLALYLTFVEVRELQLHWKWYFWWLSFVFLTHFVGYLILRGYAVYRRWHAARAS